MEGIPKFSFWTALPCHVYDGSVWNIPKIDACMSSGAQSEQGSIAAPGPLLPISGRRDGTTARLGAAASRSTPFIWTTWSKRKWFWAGANPGHYTNSYNGSAWGTALCRTWSKDYLEPSFPRCALPQYPHPHWRQAERFLASSRSHRGCHGRGEHHMEAVPRLRPALGLSFPPSRSASATTSQSHPAAASLRKCSRSWELGRPSAAELLREPRAAPGTQPPLPWARNCGTPWGAGLHGVHTPPAQAHGPSLPSLMFPSSHPLCSSPKCGCPAHPSPRSLLSHHSPALPLSEQALGAA